ncbi:MAG: asparagine synthase (glutamine-hydrolyzing) [Thermoanaerobaculaceae bacterium]|nr:asparagine synthase (glutamine-hydrolyzing) [Thermoanaerobaculaceae bacterium]
MCGICGEFNYEGTKAETTERIKKMVSLLAHRGPDDEGFFIDDKVALGHRRLSIIDLSKEASQPMFSPSNRSVLVYNGEIYNFYEIREELEKRGEVFKTHSDSEVLLRAYEVWGLDFVQKLNGMWALAIYDKQKRQMILSRDRIGEKPLYFAHTKKGVIFSSEIHPLFESKSAKKEIDRKALAECVACRYVLAPKTLMKWVKKIPPGHFLVISDKETKLFPYYKIPLSLEIKEIKEEESVSRFAEIFEKSVEKRLISDVPLGVLLSGGLDSTAIVAAAKSVGVEKLSTFTVGFEEGGSFDEREQALLVSKVYNTEHTDFLISAEKFVEGLEGVLHHQDDPVADLALLPLYYLCKEAKSKVKVLLSGQGADEVLGGYHLERVLRQIKAISFMRKIPGAGVVAKMYSRFDKKREYLLKWDELKKADLGQIPAKIRYDLTTPLSSEVMNKLFKEKVEPPFDRTLDAFYSEVPKERGAIDAILGTLMKGWLPDNLLNHSDRMSMANSIEIRCPFLDPELIDYLFTIPENYKVTSNETKRLLRKWALIKGVPKEIILRRKKGFPVPWERWLRGELHYKVKERVLSTNWFKDYFNINEIENIFIEQLKGRENGILIWNLLILSHWGQIMGV